MASELQKFIKWAKELSKNDTLLAHFYIEQEKKEKKGLVLVKKIVDPPCFFIFNILSKDKYWQVKGTSGHGVCGTKFYVPILNCWKVDTEFFGGLKKYYAEQKNYQKYRYAIIISKNKLANVVRDIVDVEFYKGEHKNSKNCWHFDVPKQRKSLAPFNYCKVVRAKIPTESITKEPIFRIPPKAIVGIMIQYGNKQGYRNLLNQKGMSHVRLFSL